MTITAIESIRGNPFISRSRAAKDFDVSVTTIDNYIRDIEKEVSAGRYGPHSIVKSGGLTLISYTVLIDYLKYRKRLKDKNARKYVPAFSARETGKELGFYDEAFV